MSNAGPIVGAGAGMVNTHHHMFQSLTKCIAQVKTSVRRVRAVVLILDVCARTSGLNQSQLGSRA